MKRSLVDREILHAVKAEHRAWCSKLETNHLCLRLLSPLLYLLLLTLVFYIYFHLLFIASIIFTCWFSLSKSRRQLSTSTHYLEEYREVLQPFIVNPFSFLDLS